MTQQVQKCRSCGAPVIWLRHDRTGNLAPIDAEPGGNGNCLPIPSGHYVNLTPLEMLDPDNQGKVHTNHFQTCKDKEMWRNHGNNRG
ncbi:MAG: hypothetical protein M3P51_02360 [Chloroflexota bacterium]|nr:hypothetical protein [Chloroflexota bacterium]